MHTWGDQGLRRVFPSLELTTATCGAEHQMRQMRHMMRLQTRIRQMEFKPRRQPVLCGRCSVVRWIFGHLCQAKGDNERNRAVLAKELQAGGYPRVVVRSDGEAALLAHVRAVRAMTMAADVPLGSLHEQVSKEQSAGNGLAEGAVKELKAKMRTLTHNTEMTLETRIPETHDSLAWLVTHAAPTINWFRPVLDGKTPYELRVGRKFRRVVAEGLVDECREARESHQR